MCVCVCVCLNLVTSQSDLYSVVLRLNRANLGLCRHVVLGLQTILSSRRLCLLFRCHGELLQLFLFLFQLSYFSVCRLQFASGAVSFVSVLLNAFCLTLCVFVCSCDDVLCMFYVCVCFHKCAEPCAFVTQLLLYFSSPESRESWSLSRR